MKKDFVCQEGFATKYGVSVIITRKNVECFMRPLICCFQEGSGKQGNVEFTYKQISLA
jgi:hypothetical protein